MPVTNLIALIQARVAAVAKAFAWNDEFPADDPALGALAQKELTSRVTPDHLPLLLTWAAADGHVALASAALAAGASPDATAEPHCKYRPVLLAARAGHLEIVRVLAQVNANLGFGTDSLGERAGIWSLPLAQAIMGHHNEVAVFLARTKAAIVPMSRHCEFLIGLAAEHGTDAAIPILVSLGYSPNTPAPLQELTPLMQAAAKGHTAAAKALLDAGADPNAPVNADPSIARYSATSALILAAMEGHYAIAELLLAAGADTATTDYHGATAHTWAKRNGHRDLAHLLKQHTTSAGRPSEQLMDAIENDDLPATLQLISAGCDLEGKTPVCWSGGKPATGGQTPLMRAAELGRVEAIRALLEVGADPTALSDPTEDAEITAVHYAAKAGQLDAIRILMAAVPAKQRKGNLGVTGCTPLQLAAEKGRLAAMEVLLECGASLAGSVGGSCLYKAACYGHEDIIRFLLMRGVSPDDPGRYRYPPLIGAVQEKRESVVRLLLEAGANVNALSRDGWTALNHAEYDCLNTITKILKDAGGKLADDMPKGPGKPKPAKPAVTLPKRPKQYATGRMADRPTFRITSALQAAAKKLESSGGLKREQSDTRPGVFLFTLGAKDAVGTVQRYQQELLDAGCYLFLATRNLTGTETLVLAPTGNVYEAIAWTGTNGANHGIGSENIIDALSDIADDNPFVLWTITHDCLEGRFTGRLRSPRSVASLFAALAPDTVTQGTGTVSALAQELRGTRPRLFLWWD